MHERKTAVDGRGEEALSIGQELCIHLAGEAGLTVLEMEKAWANTADSQLAEIKALHYGIGLMRDCNKATARTDEGREVATLLAYNGNPVSRYDARMALAHLTSYDYMMSPYSAAMDRLLSVPRSQTLEEICQEFVAQEPALARTWHNWLWPRGLAENDHGGASLFAIAASRLSQSMGDIVAGLDAPSA